MPLDLQKLRVGTSNLDRSISSEDVNQQGAALTIESIRNYDRSIRGGLSEFGQGIAAGINTRTQREENALERATARRADALRQADMSQREGADLLRANARLVPLEQLARENLKPGENLPSVADLSRRGVSEVFGPNMPYDKMSPAMRSQVDALTQTFMGKRALVHTGEVGAERKLGKYGDPDYTGEHPSEALGRGIDEYHEALRKLQTSDPFFRKEFVELADRNEAIQKARDRHQYEVAGTIEQYPGDKRIEGAARELQPRWQSEEVMPFTTGRQTLKEAVLGLKPGEVSEFAAKNMMRVEQAWPRIGITTQGGKRVVKTEFDDDNLRGMGDADKKVMQRYLGSSIGAAHGAWTGWKVSDKVLRHIVSGKWATTPEQKSAQATLAQMVNSGDVTKEEARAHLVNMFGWGDVDPQQFEGQLGGGKGKAFLTRLAEARRLSPDLDHVFFRGAGDATGEADELFKEEYDAGIDHNQVITAPGPLAYMLEEGFSPAEVAMTLQSFKDTTTTSPFFTGFKDHLLAMGLDKRSASRAAQELYPELEKRIQGVTQTFQWADGRTFNDLSKREQELTLRQVAEDLARPYVRESRVAAGAESRSASAALAGEKEPLLSRVEAKRMTDAAVRADKKMGEGQGRIQVGKGLEIHVDRGEPKWLLRKKADGTEEAVQFADQQPDAVDLGQAFALSREIFGKTAAAAPRKGLSMMGADVFDPKVSGFFDMKLGDGVTAYQWAHSRLSGREAPTAEDVRALRDGLSRYAAESGMTEFELKQRFADAAVFSEDPVVDGLAIFLEQVLSTKKDTVQDLRAIEGDSPGAQLKKMGDKAYREGGDDSAGQPPAQAGGGFVQVFQEGTAAAAARTPAPEAASGAPDAAMRRAGDRAAAPLVDAVETVFPPSIFGQGPRSTLEGLGGKLVEGMVGVEDAWRWAFDRNNRSPGYLKQSMEVLDVLPTWGKR